MRTRAAFAGWILLGQVACNGQVDLGTPRIHDSGTGGPVLDGSVTGTGGAGGTGGDIHTDDGSAEDGICVPGPAPVRERGSCSFAAGALPSRTLGTCLTGKHIPVEHIVLLMQESRSFDHYLGHLPGHGQDEVDTPAEDTSNPGADPDRDAGDTSDGGDAGAPVGWHHLSDPCFDTANDGWGPSHLAWNQGKNDGFVVENAGANDPLGFDPGGTRAMGYYDVTDLPFYYALASTFAISDRYFSDVMGPALPNRRFFYAASAAGYTDDQTDAVDYRTIFQVLTERNISWKVYMSDVAGAFFFHSFPSDSGDKIVEVAEFAKDAAAGTLPQVAWVDPLFLLDEARRTSEQPPADMQVGQHFVFEQVRALLSSPSWPSSAMFITYAGHGGLYDHVSPPPACAPDDTPAHETGFGGFDRYGFRVPVLVVSPFSKAHFVSHAVHSHSSILRFIEAKFDLPAFSRRDANADAMLDMLDFARPRFVTPPELLEPPVDPDELSACTARYRP